MKAKTTLITQSINEFNLNCGKKITELFKQEKTQTINNEWLTFYDSYTSRTSLDYLLFLYVTRSSTSTSRGSTSSEAKMCTFRSQVA